MEILTKRGYNMKDNNTGNGNTGNWNTGNCNTGDGNTGDWNTGNWNTGDCNTGDWNTGRWNTGRWNTGRWNTGRWNTCDRENGCFNTVQSEKIRVFNSIVKRSEWENYDKPRFLYFTLIDWITESEMTEEEKRNNTTYKDTGGYLKKYEYKEAFKKSWDNANKEDRKRILDCPNFDNGIFFDISGIDVNKELQTKKVTIELTEEQLEKIKHLI
jgi:hypothetical protein